ncbi:hypothetical protein MCC_07715 (plasmid) [Rickettsia rhipicephali str. 3-7-female6-CWPP]|uniref:Uncharacterized protein n=1 Tax=Rickettsia rhipicephali (strain 3-7-female6-CWPP) TaxID=1105113 RepID=A0AAI8AB18_RICR3|nr:hypothetical protein [Rickettsia rhipicephali]AFC72967.1 hypothetical protein MCC_07715 [Rickettsia rhipicephali str. 3-7-female6-CWPP]
MKRLNKIKARFAHTTKEDKNAKAKIEYARGCGDRAYEANQQKHQDFTGSKTAAARKQRREDFRGI